MEEITTSSMIITYEQGLLTAIFREKAVIDQKDAMEFVEAIKKLVKGDKFVTLIDGRYQHFMVQAAQDLLRKNASPNRLALAILSNDTQTEKRVEKYIHSAAQVASSAPTRQFKDKQEAIDWLKTHLPGHDQ